MRSFMYSLNKGHFQRNRFSRRRFIQNAMAFHGSMNRAGTPSILLQWSQKPQNANWRPYLSRLDHKYSHKVMRKSGLLS